MNYDATGNNLPDEVIGKAQEGADDYAERDKFLFIGHRLVTRRISFRQRSAQIIYNLASQEKKTNNQRSTASSAASPGAASFSIISRCSRRLSSCWTWAGRALSSWLVSTKRPITLARTREARCHFFFIIARRIPVESFIWVDAGKSDNKRNEEKVAPCVSALADGAPVHCCPSVFAIFGWRLLSFFLWVQHISFNLRWDHSLIVISFTSKKTEIRIARLQVTFCGCVILLVLFMQPF